MSKRQLDTENKENEEPNSAKKAKIIDHEDIQKPESLTDEEEEEEEKELWPIASVIEHNNGRIHPTKNQYFLYENTVPTMISNTARFWSRKYLKVLRNVNPDLYDVMLELFNFNFTRSSSFFSLDVHP